MMSRALGDLSRPEEPLNWRYIAFGAREGRDLRIRIDSLVFIVDLKTMKNAFEYFDAFSSFGGAETRDREIVMNGTPSAQILHILLDFVYLGKLKVTPRNIVEVLQAADFLLVKVPAMVLFLHAFSLRVSLQNWTRYFKLVQNEDFNYKANVRFVLYRWMNDNMDLIRKRAAEEDIDVSVVKPIEFDEKPARQVKRVAAEDSNLCQLCHLPNCGMVDTDWIDDEFVSMRPLYWNIIGSPDFSTFYDFANVSLSRRRPLTVTAATGQSTSTSVQQNQRRGRSAQPARSHHGAQANATWRRVQPKIDNLKRGKNKFAFR
ncbi:uncharacterized protein [Ptychodera flava]|uniref:uncharacterized protein n=1 Tax=Ptychodera flava TaxID=63121 RepID=UPI00396AA487